MVVVGPSFWKLRFPLRTVILKAVPSSQIRHPGSREAAIRDLLDQWEKTGFRREIPDIWLRQIPE